MINRLALGVAAIAALTTLTACGGSDSDSSSDAGSTPPASASESASQAAAPAEDRFQTVYTDTAALFAVISEQTDVHPADAAEANAAAGLDDTTSLLFIDYTVDPQDDSTGAFCLASPEGTFVSFAYSGAAGEATLGDGECSYDAADAVVVGDVSTDEWSQGGELMGDLLPTSVFAQSSS